MSELVKSKPSNEISFTTEQVDLIKSQVAVGATDGELKLFLYQAQRMGLDPLARQIYCIKRKGKMTIQTSIDGYRLTADRTGKYAGNDDPIYDDEDNPRKATVTVYKIVGGVRCPFTSSARWDQYYPGKEQGFMWDKMPHLMLGKCAEALALRKAFPAELGGVYIQEEMEQAGRIDAEVITIKPQAQAKPASSAGYSGTPEQQAYVQSQLEKQGIDESVWEDIHKELMGKPSSELNNIIAKVIGK